VRELARLLVGALRGRVLVVVGLTLCVGFLEGVGIVLLLPLLALAGLDGAGGAPGTFTKALSDLFGRLGLDMTLGTVLVVYVALCAIRELVAHRQQVSSVRLRSDFVAHVRKRLFTAVMRTRWRFHSRLRSADVTHGLTTEADWTGVATNYLIALTTETVLCLVDLAIALRLSSALTGVSLLAGVLIVLGTRSSIRRTRQRGMESSDTVNEWHRGLSEQLAGAKLVRAHGWQAPSVALFSDTVDRIARTEVATLRSLHDTRRGLNVLTVVVLAALVWTAVRWLHLPPASVVVLVYLYSRLMRRASSMQQHVQFLVGLLPSFDRILRLEADCRREEEPEPAGDEPVALEQEIRLAHVSFAYGTDAVPRAVEDVSVVIPARQTTAIVGPSGSGKSTVVDLVVGLLRPDHGEVRVDGAPLRESQAAAWRRGIGYVAQEPFLFHDTIRANLAWAAPTTEAAALERALAMADAAEFVARLPQGLDTVVGDRGATLSGGERQRLALARALLRSPGLLVLDEATSNLDSESERRIQATVDALHGKTTILVVTHRLATARHADLLHVTDGGRVVDSGTWDDLVARPDGRLRALCEAQGLSVPPPPSP
jgi:ATP-binding cassette subfamily C protein